MSRALTISNERLDGDTESFVTHSLTSEGFDASEDGTGRGTPLTVERERVVNALDSNQGGPDDNSAQAGHLIASHELSPTLDGRTGDGPRRNQGGVSLIDGPMVRRLTPTECERLQALPDGWTLLEESDDPNPLPDGRRYAACGDAVTASVAEWIGRRLLIHTPATPSQKENE